MKASKFSEAQIAFVLKQAEDGTHARRGLCYPGSFGAPMKTRSALAHGSIGMSRYWFHAETQTGLTAQASDNSLEDIITLAVDAF